MHHTNVHCYMPHTARALPTRYTYVCAIHAAALLHAPALRYTLHAFHVSCPCAAREHRQRACSRSAHACAARVLRLAACTVIVSIARAAPILHAHCRSYPVCAAFLPVLILDASLRGFALTSRTGEPLHPIRSGVTSRLASQLAKHCASRDAPRVAP